MTVEIERNLGRSQHKGKMIFKDKQGNFIDIEITVEESEVKKINDYDLLQNNQTEDGKNIYTGNFKP